MLALLALQASFLVPPTGYAVMMARSAMAAEGRRSGRSPARSRPILAPSSWCWRWSCCCRGSPISPSPRPAHAPPVEKLDDEAARKRFNDMLNLPPPPEE